MAKKESTFINMVLTLFVVTAVGSASLGFVFKFTKEPIAAARLAKKIKAIGEVVPEFNNAPNDEFYTVDVDESTLVFYPAKKDGELVGTAVETFTKKGFSGDIKLMVGLLPDGKISKVEVLEHKETPGLGDKMESKKSKFSEQFEGKDPSVFKLIVQKDGGDVDAITASTISSRAYCDAVQRAYNIYKEGGQDE